MQTPDPDSWSIEARRPHPASAERWPLEPFRFKPLLHNALVSGLALRLFKLRTRGLEKFVFTATTGRSGTLTLSRLFAAVPGCAAVHEAQPVMNGWILRAASYGDTALVDRVYRRVKAVNIRRAAVGRRYYMEANHLFIKSFVRNVLEDFGERVAVVHLVRPALEVAMSIWCLQDHPGTERGDYWWLDYRAPSNLIAIADVLDSDPEFSHPFYKALWYWHEVEARIAAWRCSAPATQVVRFETQWLNDADRVADLLTELGIRFDRSALDRAVGTRAHEKADQKLRAALPAAAAEDMLRRFRRFLGRGGGTQAVDAGSLNGGRYRD